MKISKALKQYIEEIESYEEYMGCYEEYKTTYPEHAKYYHQMAMQEKTHAETLLDMYPELKDMINKLKMHNPK